LRPIPWCSRESGTKGQRTVEGDLGLRVSARSLFETGEDYLRDRLREEGLEFKHMEEFVSRISDKIDYLPVGEKEHIFDRLLAEACVYYAALKAHWRLERNLYAPGQGLYANRERFEKGQNHYWQRRIPV